MKIGYDTNKKVFYVAEYDANKKKVVVVETSKNFDELALKYGFMADDISEEKE